MPGSAWLWVEPKLQAVLLAMGTKIIIRTQKKVFFGFCMLGCCGAGEYTGFEKRHSKHRIKATNDFASCHFISFRNLLFGFQNIYAKQAQ